MSLFGCHTKMSNNDNQSLRSHREAGWSYVEIVIAMIIFLIGLFPVLNLLNGMLKGIQVRSSKFQATLIAQTLLDEIKQKKWDENSTIPPQYLPDSSKTLRNKFGTQLSPAEDDETTSNIDTWDDIDDYNAMTNYNIEPGYLCDVTVTYVVFDGSGKVVLPVPITLKTDYKQITVTITFESSPQNMVTINAIMANNF